MGMIGFDRSEKTTVACRGTLVGLLKSAGEIITAKATNFAVTFATAFADNIRLGMLAGVAQAA